MADPWRHSWGLRAYLAASPLIGLFAPWVLRKRLARGREDPARWREKLGEATQPRPDGPLVWLHAVGLGEVLALRGLIESMAAEDPDLWFLVTSTARSSAQVFAANCPARTVHQYLPLDAPRYLARFLDHWQPDLSIWAEQDLWPGAVVATDRQGIPLALVNARMNAKSYQKRRWLGAVYRSLYPRFRLIAAQDAASAAHLVALGATDVAVTGSIKIAAPDLAVDAAELGKLQDQLEGRLIWLAASTHAEDEAVALKTQAALYAQDPRWLLILVPRDPKRLMAIDMPFARRSVGELPQNEPVYLADGFGELGLWYRLADTALIGGSFGAVEGHNPWEAAALGCAILHGPNIANFAADYAALHQAGAAQQVGENSLKDQLLSQDLDAMADRAYALVLAGRQALQPLAEELVADVYED